MVSKWCEMDFATIHSIRFHGLKLDTVGQRVGKAPGLAFQGMVSKKVLSHFLSLDFKLFGKTILVVKNSPTARGKIKEAYGDAHKEPYKALACKEF